MPQERSIHRLGGSRREHRTAAGGTRPAGCSHEARERIADVERRGRRTFARPCLDWSERRHHLAGALGAAIARSMLEDGWVDRSHAGRALFVTDRGQAGLESLLGIEVDAARGSAVPAMRRLAGVAVG